MSSIERGQNLGQDGLRDRETNGGRFADREQHEHGVVEPADLLRIALVIAAAAVVWFIPRFGWLGVAGVLVGGFPIFAEAYQSLRDRRMTMELSMTLALLAALVIREYFTALIITLFVLVAEILEGLTMSRGRQAIADLLTQRALDDFGDHRCGGVRDRGWNAAGDSWRSGASCTAGSNHQRRSVP